MTTGRHHRPLKLISEELVRDALAMSQIFVSTLPTEDAEDRLHEQRRRDQLSIEEVCKRIEMSGVIALEFDPGAMALSETLKDVLDVAEGVAEDPIWGLSR